MLFLLHNNLEHSVVMADEHRLLKDQKQLLFNHAVLSFPYWQLQSDVHHRVLSFSTTWDKMATTPMSKTSVYKAKVRETLGEYNSRPKAKLVSTGEWCKSVPALSSLKSPLNEVVHLKCITSIHSPCHIAKSLSGS